VEGDAGNLNKANFPRKSFDLITFSAVVEHLYDPIKTIREGRELLKDDGILMILVPNIESATSQLFGPYWYHLDVPRHLYHFSFRTARKLLKKTGFKSIYESNYAKAHAKASLTDSLKMYRLSKNTTQQKNRDQ
jgi:predicted SAM-dependent methyltransferase